MMSIKEFEHTPQIMAEKLMEFNRDFSDCEADVEEETVSVAEQFAKLQKSVEMNALAHHLDLMFMDDVFALEERQSEPDVRIAGLFIEHGEEDYGFWEGFYLTESEESSIWKILDRHSAEGCSMRGTRQDVAEEITGMSVSSDEQLTSEELMMLSDGLLALIRDVNEAAKLVPDGSANSALRELAEKYQTLNSKICAMIK